MNTYQIFFMEWDELGEPSNRYMNVTANDIEDAIAIFYSQWNDADVMILTIKYVG